jgi:hypothetical protein
MNMMTAIRSRDLAPVSEEGGAEVIGTEPLPSRVDVETWNDAMSRYRTAKAMLAAHCEGEMRRAAECWSRVRGQWPLDHDFSKDPLAKAQLDGASILYDPIEAEFDRLVDDCSDTMGAMMVTCAPDLEALAYKIDVFFEEDCSNRTWDRSAAIQRTMKADAARFASTKPASPTKAGESLISPLVGGSRAITQSFYKAFALDRAQDDGHPDDAEAQFAWASILGADLRIVECGIYDGEHAAVAALALAARLDGMIDGHRMRGKNGKPDHIELDEDVRGEVALILRGLNNIVRFHEKAEHCGDGFKPYADYVRKRCRLRA